MTHCEVDGCENEAKSDFIIENWTDDEWHDYEPRTISICNACMIDALGWEHEGAFFHRRVATCNHKAESWNPYSTLYVTSLDPIYEYCRGCGDVRKVAA